MIYRPIIINDPCSKGYVDIYATCRLLGNEPLLETFKK